MEKEFVITSGGRYIDIDAYAACFAYQRLLEHLGYRAIAATSAIQNESIPALIRDLGFTFTPYTEKENQTFIVLDVSNPDFIDPIVKTDKIGEIIDHHTGFESYWKSPIHSQIEFIGSVCTMIFERFRDTDTLFQLDSKMCKLLIAGILDNTLNLKSGSTTERDLIAYQTLLKLGHIEKDWPQKYFESCQAAVEADLSTALHNDIKREKGNLLPSVIGQLLVIDHHRILAQKETIETVLSSYREPWMLNLISLSDGKSYILTGDDDTERKLEELFQRKGQDRLLILDPFMLRKEIIKLDQKKMVL